MAAGIYPYFRPIDSDQGAAVMMNGKETLMLGSNNYLGLTNHPRVKKAAQAAVEQFGTGCAGSRFLNGTLSVHIECEERLAEFIGKESVLVFSTGYQANVGAIATLGDRHETLVTDELAHASIFDSARLSFAKMVKFSHNNMASLEQKLIALGDKQKIVITEGVFSMEGDTVRLPEMVKLCKKYNADLILDDAHGVGVYGDRGEGTAGHFGLTDEVDIIVGTFSKSLASIGGFVGASEDIIHYMKHNSRALMFSASPPPASVAAVIEALKIIKEEPERRELLWRNTEYLRKGLHDLGLSTELSDTPIIPVLVGDMITAFTICHMLQEEGVFINPVIPPAVQPHQCLIRFSVMSTHTLEQLDTALERLARVVKKVHLSAEVLHPADNHSSDQSTRSEGISSISVEGSGK
ncbi:aminotransferase class I/II-fold pyridoxal phosphate-dependent enzyme [bacterium]|nr:MAG: aminotransferase class I/II-fold pyridoxal phosphate-dependent enzyme [bacterium]